MPGQPLVSVRRFVLMLALSSPPAAPRAPFSFIHELHGKRACGPTGRAPGVESRRARLVGARPDSRLERGFEADFVHAGVTLTRRTRCAAGPGRAGGAPAHRVSNVQSAMSNVAMRSCCGNGWICWSACDKPYLCSLFYFLFHQNILWHFFVRTNYL